MKSNPSIMFFPSRKRLPGIIINLNEKREIAVNRISSLLMREANLSKEDAISQANHMLNSYLLENMNSPSEYLN
jgi:hypothetical protein